jgi:hypothetical protein
MSDDVPTCYDEVDVDELTDEIVTAIQRPRKGDRDDTDPGGFMDPGILPGFGVKDGCGETTVPYHCVGCGSVVPMGRTCYRSTCPRCAPMWVVEAAVPNLARLQTTAKTMSARLGRRTSVSQSRNITSSFPRLPMIGTSKRPVL